MKGKELTPGLSICLDNKHIHLIESVTSYESNPSIAIFLRGEASPTFVDAEQDIPAIYISDRAKTLSLDYLELPKPVLMFLSELKKVEPLSHYEFLNGYVAGHSQQVIKSGYSQAFLLGYSFGAHDYLKGEPKC
jgi:hypothetical protein